MATRDISAGRDSQASAVNAGDSVGQRGCWIRVLARRWGLPFHSLPYFLAVGATTVLVFGQNLYAAKMLGPAVFGIWNIFAITYSYGLLIHGGVLNGLARELPRARATGDETAVNKLIYSSFWTNAFGTAVFAAASFFVLQHLFVSNSQVTRRILLTFTVFLVLQGWTNFLTFLFRARDEFTTLSVLILFINVGVLIGAFLFIPGWKLQGFLFAWAATYFLASLGFLAKAPPGLFALPDRRLAWHLLRVGAPILLFTLTATINWTMDRLLILRFLGVAAVGYYAVASFAVRLLTYVPEMISHVMFPHWAVTKFLRHTSAVVSRPFRLVFWIMPVLGGVGYYGCFFIPTFLPQFRSSVVLSQVLCIGTSLAGIGLFCGAYLGATGDEKVAFRAQAWTLVLRTVVVGSALWFGGTLVRAALASAVSGAVFGVVLLWITGRVLNATSTFVFQGLLPWTLCTGWLFVIELLRRDTILQEKLANLPGAALAGFAFVAGALVLMFVLARWPGSRRLAVTTATD